MSQDDDYERVFGAQPLGPQPIHGAFTERLMATAEAKGYLKPPQPQAAPAETVIGSGEYKAYGFLRESAGESCDLRFWMPGTSVAEGLLIQYRFLLSIGYTGEEHMRLRLPDMIVEIEGVALGELRRKVASRQVAFIQQYSPRVWPRSPEGEPVVEKIEIVRPEMHRG